MNSSSHPVSGADSDISDIGDLLDNLNILLHDIPLDSASLNLIGELSRYFEGVPELDFTSVASINKQKRVKLL